MPNKLKRVHLYYIKNKKGVKENVKVDDLSLDAKQHLNSFFKSYKNKKDKGLITLDIEDRSKEIYSILIIGPQRTTGYHFSEKMFDAFHELGYTVHYRCPQDLSNDKAYYTKEKRFNLSDIDIHVDLIIIDECQFNWENDVNTTVWAHQREFKRPPTVFHPDVVFMWHQGMIDYWETIFAPEWMSKVKYHEVLNITVDPKKFKSRRKKYKGVNGIGFRESLEQVQDIKEFAIAGDAKLLFQEEQEFKELGYNYIDTPVSDKQYWDVMPQCEALWIPLSIKQYISHRMLECMASKTLCLIKLEGWEHERVLEEMGLENGVHYVGAEALDHFETQLSVLYNKNVQKDIIKIAYNYVTENLTDVKCAESLIDLYYEKGFTSNQFDVICPVYWVNEYFNDNINNWFRELPIRKLYLGIGKKDLKLNIPQHPQIEIIDQTHIRTLGGCLKDLMDRVETKWFVFVHADVEITKNALKIMEPEMKAKVGIIESERLHWDGKTKVQHGEIVPWKTYDNYHERRRSFSGFQIIRKEAIQSVLDKIEDDYLYRNEDMILQACCNENDYKYVKTYSMHIHQTINTIWSETDEKTHEMQWKGFVKYTQPSKYTLLPCILTIKHMRKYGLTLSHCLFFCFQHNPDWGYHIREGFLQWEKESGKIIQS